MESWREEELIAFIQNTLCLTAHVWSTFFCIAGPLFCQGLNTDKNAYYFVLK